MEIPGASGELWEWLCLLSSKIILFIYFWVHLFFCFRGKVRQVKFEACVISTSGASSGSQLL